MKIFKKGVLCMFAALLGLAVFSGCSKEGEPFSYYQIGVVFPTITAETDPHSLEYQIAEQVVLFMRSNMYIYTTDQGNPIIIKGAIESENDAEATRFYNNKLADVQKANADGKLAQAIREGKYKDAEGNPITLPTPGSIFFEYKMTKGMSVISNFLTQGVLVDF